MQIKHSTSRNAFTLLELMAAILVMSIISVVLMPVMASASDSFIVARQVRSSTERSGFALDRAVRVIRQAPIGPSDSGVGITTATTTALEFSDGTGFQLINSTLELLVPGEDPVPLCRDVDSFTIKYLANDGTTDTIAQPTTTHRFQLTLITDGVSLSVIAHPRVWIGQGG